MVPTNFINQIKADRWIGFWKIKLISATKRNDRNLDLVKNI